MQAQMSSEVPISQREQDLSDIKGPANLVKTGLFNETNWNYSAADRMAASALTRSS